MFFDILIRMAERYSSVLVLYKLFAMVIGWFVLAVFHLRLLSVFVILFFLQGSFALLEACFVLLKNSVV